jgi:hypothetical protein
MQVIHVYASPNDLNKLLKRIAPFGTPGFIGCQIARDNVQGGIWSWVSAEIVTST